MAEVIEEIKLAEVDPSAPEIEKEAAAGVDRKHMLRRLNSAIKKAIPTLEIDDHLNELAADYAEAVDYDQARTASRELEGYVNDRLEGYASSLRNRQNLKYTKARTVCAAVMGEPRTVAIVLTVWGKQQFLRKWEAEVRGYFVIKLGEYSDA